MGTVLILNSLSCKKDQDVATPDLGYDYYPTTTGSWVIYDVDSFVYDDFNCIDSLYQYQVKQVIAGTEEDASGRTTYRLERYIRDTVGDAWSIKDVWVTYFGETRVEVYEENVWYIKMIFPPKQNDTWNGNALNINDRWNYWYSAVDANTTVGEVSFDSVATVIQYDNSNLIEKQYYEERYARGIGLIYKEIIERDYQDTCLQLSYSGLEFTMSVNSYGQE